MRNILVIGGTRFFGRRLVEKLIQNGDRVVVASHNFSKTNFGERILPIELEREQPLDPKGMPGARPLRSRLRSNLLFSQRRAIPLRNAGWFCRQAGFYLHPIRLYKNGILSEIDFDPCDYPARLGLRADFNYGEGKRLAEAVFCREASFPVTAVRFPFVLGPDDYSNRLDFHMERVLEDRPIVAPTPGALTSMISSEEAAEFLFWVGRQSYSGAINACSNGNTSLKALLGQVGIELQRVPRIAESGDSSDFSPYNQKLDRLLNNARARELGFHFSDLEEWLKPLIFKRAQHFLAGTS